MLDGKDVDLSLNGGYYDVGDNCKSNYPVGDSINIAWSAIDFADVYKKPDK